MVVVLVFSINKNRLHSHDKNNQYSVNELNTLRSGRAIKTVTLLEGTAAIKDVWASHCHLVRHRVSISTKMAVAQGLLTHIYFTTGTVVMVLLRNLTAKFDVLGRAPTFVYTALQGEDAIEWIEQPGGFVVRFIYITVLEQHHLDTMLQCSVRDFTCVALNIPDVADIYAVRVLFVWARGCILFFPFRPEILHWGSLSWWCIRVFPIAFHGASSTRSGFQLMRCTSCLAIYSAWCTCHFK